MTVANKKRLEEADQRWLRKTLHISWKDKVTNARLWELTEQNMLENIKESKLM